MSITPKLTIVLAVLTLTGCTGLKVDPMMTATHLSDITRGYPEPTTDYVGVGATLRWHHLEVDISYGIRTQDCGALRGHSCGVEGGTAISTRFYPLGRRP